jgi:ankyrin repeat protein
MLSDQPFHNQIQEKETPLHISTKYGNYDLISTFLGAGADINSKSGPKGRIS